MNPDKLEKDLLLKNNLIYGIDEVGRSCIAGPMGFALICYNKSILDHGIGYHQIKDSKILSETKRLSASLYISRVCKNFVVTLPKCTSNLVDPYKNALKYIIDNADLNKDSHIFVDNGIKRYFPAGFNNIYEYVKGDSKIFSIASASIMAKVHRDTHMRELHSRFKEYTWASNVGYPSPSHWEAIEKYGLTCHHRKFFKRVAEYEYKM